MTSMGPCKNVEGISYKNEEEKWNTKSRGSIKRLGHEILSNYVIFLGGWENMYFDEGFYQIVWFLWKDMKNIDLMGGFIKL